MQLVAFIGEGAGLLMQLVAFIGEGAGLLIATEANENVKDLEYDLAKGQTSYFCVVLTECTKKQASMVASLYVGWGSKTSLGGVIVHHSGTRPPPPSSHK